MTTTRKPLDLNAARRLLRPGETGIPGTVERITPEGNGATTHDDGERFAFVDLSRDPPPVPWMIPGWLARGDVALLCGPPYSGKSTLAASLAVAVASGGSWCGIPVAQPGPVIVFDEEQSAGTTHRMYREAGGPVECLRVAAGQGLNLSSDDDLAALEAVIREGSPVLVVLDSAQVTFGVESVKDNDQVAAVFKRRLRPLRDSYGTAFLIIHHTRKPAPGVPFGPTQLADILGAQAFGAQSDAVLLYSLAGTVGELRLAKRRDGEGPRDGLRISSERVDGRLLLSNAGTVQQSETALAQLSAMLREYVQAHGAAESKDLIAHAAAAGYPKQRVHEALNHLLRLEAVRRPRRGLWIPPDGPGLGLSGGQE